MRRKTIYLIQIYLPLENNSGIAFGPAKFAAVQKELTAHFGGLTAFTRAPADGLWGPEAKTLHHDKIIIFEVLVESVDEGWWKQYREKLEKGFAQESIQILAQEVEKL